MVEVATAAVSVVLVHGGFVDGSGWDEVYKILRKDGYQVSIVQNPTTSLADDVAATRRVIAEQKSPVVLVGHSYGGVVITEAGTDPRVASFIASRQHRPRRDRPHDFAAAPLSFQSKYWRGKPIGGRHVLAKTLYDRCIDSRRTRARCRPGRMTIPTSAQAPPGQKVVGAMAPRSKPIAVEK